LDGIYLADEDSGVPHVTDLGRLLHAAGHLESDEETEERTCGTFFVAEVRSVAHARRWKEVAGQLNIAKPEIDRMSLAFEHQETEAARVLTA
jgi:hypothetical protein